MPPLRLHTYSRIEITHHRWLSQFESSVIIHDAATVPPPLFCYFIVRAPWWDPNLIGGVSKRTCLFQANAFSARSNNGCWQYWMIYMLLVCIEPVKLGRYSTGVKCEPWLRAETIFIFFWEIGKKTRTLVQHIEISLQCDIWLVLHGS